jgi:hypothetical protein
MYPAIHSTIKSSFGSHRQPAGVSEVPNALGHEPAPHGGRLFQASDFA